MIKRSCLIVVVLALTATLGMLGHGQQPQPADQQKSKHDSMEMNQRGDKVMGFDHLKTTHHFLLRKNGGVIQVLTNDVADTESRDQIRGHLHHIAKMFSEGNFAAPMLIHAKNPPGADVMKQLKDEIKYEFGETERGAQIQISTDNADALKAIHEFLRFQIKEHMTGDPTDVGR